MLLNNSTRKSRKHEGADNWKNKDLEKESKKIQEMFENKRKTLERKNTVSRTQV